MNRNAAVFGEALFDLATEETLDSKIMEQLDVLLESFAAAPEFMQLLSSPALPKQERCTLLDDAFREQLHSYVLNFLKLLTEKDAIRGFSDAAAAYRRKYQQAHNILPVTAVTAAPLTAGQEARLTQKLSAMTGKCVELSVRIDPDCLGGIRLDYDGKQLDDTLTHRLEKLRSHLKNTTI